jgi:SAM-dependent methyltransferase
MIGNLQLENLNKCRVCGGKLQLFEEIENIPLEGSKLTDRPTLSDRYDSAVYLCPDCGLYQMPDINNFSDFYNFSNTKYIKSLNDARKEVFEELTLYMQTQQNVLGIEDVGFSPIAERYFHQVITIDPEKLCKEGAGENAHYILDECSRMGLYTKDSLDGVYIICPLAHVHNPLQIMRDICSLLKEGGVGWIEVLNGETLISQVQYFNFMPILLNYWTPHSISMLLRLSGLETMVIRPGLGGDHLNVFFRKQPRKSSLVEKRTKQVDYILDEIARHKKVVIWGAGAKAHYLFGYLSDKLQVSHIVDGSPAKEGLYMPGARVPIERPSKEIFQAADLVIIFAVSYTEEITKMLRENYTYQGDICSLSE